MTHYELSVYARSWGGAQMRLATTQAWMGANWGRAKRMPNLDRVLQRIETAHRPKSPDQWTEADRRAADERVMAAATMLAAAGSAGKAEVGEG
jgi:hypothetical protein